MKLTLLFTVFSLICSANIFAQDKPCDCRAKSDAPNPCGTPITLTFDPSCGRLTDASQYWLKNKQSYYFKITGINSTLYTIKASANNVFKNGTFNMPAGFPSPATSTAVITGAFLKYSIKPTGSALAPNAVDNYFEERHKFDYDLLVLVNNKAKILLEGIGNVKTATTAAHDQACNALNEIRTEFEKLKASVKDGNAEEKKDFETVASKSICNASDFKEIIEITLNDYLNRNKLINSVDRSQGFTVDLDELAILNRENDMIVKASAFVLAAPGFINSVLNAIPEISTQTYTATDDYLQLTVTLMKPKTGPKQDTVSVNKFNFYRIKYWKALDISSGFVYDNLSSKTFYFKNSVPAAENNSGSDVSVSALLNSYWVFGSWFKAGPCAGVAVSLLDGKSKYLFGGSLVFGRNNELLLSGGYALASLPSPSNLYKNTDYTTTTTTTITGTTPSNSTTTTTQPIGTTGAVTTYSKFQGGFFIGLSYSFLKL